MAYPLTLEHLPAAGTRAGPPLLFIHGAFGTPWIWRRRFMPWFAARGHATHALGLRGTGDLRTAGLEPGLCDYHDDLARAVESIGAAPVVVAHSLGALIAQLALGTVPMRALVLLAPVPPTGMLWSSMRLALNAPSLWARTAISAAEAGFASTRTTRDALFTEDTDEVLVREAHERLAAQPVRPLLEAQWPRYVARASRLRVPVLTVAGEHDRLISVAAVERTARHHGGRHVTVTGAGHALMLDTAWERGADAIARWLDEHAAERAA